MSLNASEMIMYDLIKDYRFWNNTDPQNVKLYTSLSLLIRQLLERDMIAFTGDMSLGSSYAIMTFARFLFLQIQVR